MIHLTYITAVVICATALLFGIEYLKKCGKVNRHLTRGMALLLAAITIFVHLYRQVAVYNVRGLDMFSPFGDAMAKTALAVLLIWALADFDGLFVTFHRVAFPNGGWLLNPETDLLIRLMPLNFFISLGIRGAMRALAVPVVLDAAARIGIHRTRNKEQEA